mgnify:FL=1
MITWLDRSMIMAFPMTFLLLFFFPWVLPVVLLPGGVEFTHLAVPREWLLNHLLLPMLPYEYALSLATWWTATDYWGEVGFQFLVSLNLFVPFALIQFWVQDSAMKVMNWYYIRKYELTAQQSKKS